MSQTTPHFNLRAIAIGCLYLLTGKATLYFPGSSASHPSLKVVVDLVGKTLFREADRIHFPFSLFWGAWHEAVVPVLENKDIKVIVNDNPTLRVKINQAYLALPNIEMFLDKIEGYLTASFVASGYLPECFAPRLNEEIPENNCAPEGEPINRNPQGPADDLDEDLYHPDGTPKLPYTVVDPELLPNPNC